MADTKTPGTDGLPAEFYKTFWSDILDALIAALNFAYNIDKLSITQRWRLIKLIPKKETDLKILKSKLLSQNSSIMTRQDLSKAGLSVKIYVWSIASLTTPLTKNSIPGLILLLDFEKAFDTLEWPFIEKNLTTLWLRPLDPKMDTNSLLWYWKLHNKQWLDEWLF